MYILFTIKRYLEQLMMFPFIVAGRIYAKSKPLNKEYDLIFFFQRYGIGGAEKVHADIVNSFPDKKCLVVFTRKSHNKGMLHFFQKPYIDLVDISQYTDNYIQYWKNLFYRGVYAQYINCQPKKPKIFIGECNFGYKITPHLNRQIEISDLIHVSTKKYTWVWAPFTPFLMKRVVISEWFRKDFANIYEKNGIPKRFLSRIHVIHYNIEKIPDVAICKPFNLPLKVYYAGRGGPQKRVWIIEKIMERSICENLSVTFHLVGSFKDEISTKWIENGVYQGEVQGGEEMYNFHATHDVLLMTSAWEGFPIAIIEAMAFGSICLVPAVNAIPDFIQHKITGYVLQEITDEEKMVEEAVSYLRDIIIHRKDLNQMTAKAYDLVINNFTKEKFTQSYRNLILSLN